VHGRRRVRPGVAGRRSLRRLAAVREVLIRAPTELAQIAVYAYVDEMTHDEIARIVGCSRRQIGNLLERLRAWVREEEEGLGCEAP